MNTSNPASCNISTANGRVVSTNFFFEGDSENETGTFTNRIVTEIANRAQIPVNLITRTFQKCKRRSAKRH